MAFDFNKNDLLMLQIQLFFFTTHNIETLLCIMIFIFEKTKSLPLGGLFKNIQFIVEQFDDLKMMLTTIYITLQYL